MTKEQIQQEIYTCLKRAERSAMLSVMVQDDKSYKDRLELMTILNNYTETQLKQIDNLKQRISNEN